MIRYEYDEVGNLTKMIYPDNTAVSYGYDANHNLVRVTDWAGRVTTYSYDVNNKVVGVTKPDGSVTTTVYDLQQRITSTVERTASGAVITGFEYTYDYLSRVTEEKHLANDMKMCYTYDELSRVTKRTIRNLSSNAVLSEESYTYDAAGNITGSCGNTAFTYDINNRLTAYNGDTVSYDQDGNMLSAPIDCLTTAFSYDSANRLVSAGCHTYTYNAEDVRIRNSCPDYNTTYTYNTVGKLSQLLMKSTNGNVTKYVYGLGLIGEEKQSNFKTYHFDYRGSTVAITDASGIITDTFQYDTYGKLISRTGTSFVIFGYNGRDGVITDKNGLIYMRARYYAPELRRFVNADIIPGQISNAVTLNRYAYANGNPVSNVDPFGLSADNRSASAETATNYYQAVLVSQFSNGGLPIVGHTVLYFLGDNGKWYSTEFNTTRTASGIKNKKSEAQVWWKENVDVSAFYNTTTKEYINNPEGFNYVVLNGNFNNSVARAQSYYKNQDFGRYNLLFNNCADYTNKLLDVADIDGMSSQILSEGNTLITIPVLREIELSISSGIDSGIQWVSNGLIDAGNSIIGSNIVGDIAGNILVGSGYFIDGATNFVGDAIDVVTGVAGEVVDGVKYVAGTVTNGIIDAGTAIKDGVVSIWNELFG